jgi:uncharacterized protein
LQANLKANTQPQIMLLQEVTFIKEKRIDIKPHYSYLKQLAFLLGFVGVGFFLAAVLQLIVGLSLINTQLPSDKWGDAIIAALAKPENKNVLRCLQLGSVFFMFLLPAIVTAIIISKKSVAYLGFNGKVSIHQIFTVVALSFFALLLSGVLGEVNQIIPIPKSWATHFKAMEDNYNTSVMAMAQMKNFSEYLFVLVVIALAPALFEEVLFRAGLQQIITNWTKRPLLAIIITSVVFSAVHFSYYGFLPRATLGVVLGLIFYYSKNIWLSILLHLLNNGISITMLYFYSKNGKPSTEVLDAKVSALYGTIAAIMAGIVAITAVILLLKYFISISKKLNPVDTAVYLRTNENPFEAVDSQQSIDDRL